MGELMAGNIKIILYILVAVVLLEVSAFNIRHWSTKFLETTSSSAYDVSRDENTVHIKNINHNIRTLYLRPDFGGTGLKVADVEIIYADENYTTSQMVQLVNRYSSSFYIPMGAFGSVTELKLIVHDEGVEISEILLNQPLKFSFQILRVFMLVLAASSIALWKKYRFSDIYFSPELKWQKITDVMVLTFFIGFLLFATLFSSSIGFSSRGISWHPSRAGMNNINAHVVDAILLGQLHLDIQPDESLLNATEPYNRYYREKNDVVVPWDFVYYEGKLYSYYGVVPVIVLFLPYYLITGSYLSVSMATFIFSALASLGLYLLWRAIVQKYIPRLRYAIYLTGLAALLFGSNLMAATVRGYVYEATATAALMFSVYGILFLIKAVPDLRSGLLVASGLCFALAVGSRPTMIFISLLIPVILFPVFKNKKLIAFIIPYALTGLALMWYNYARFGSITEFGASYNLTNENVAVVTASGFLGNMRKALDGFMAFSFNNFELKSIFPFIYATEPSTVFTGYVSKTPVIGALLLPLTWFLSTAVIMRKNECMMKVKPLICTMLLISIMAAMTSAVMAGFYTRYAVDFFWLVMIASLICTGIAHVELLERKELTAALIVSRLSYFAAGITCVIMFAHGMVGENNMIWTHNPIVMRMLQDMFVIW
jgi:hypothetical protein